MPSVGQAWQCLAVGRSDAFNERRCAAMPRPLVAQRAQGDALHSAVVGA
jgi:hypothetical protein